MEEPPGADQRLWRSLDVQDALARRHPLGGTVLDDATTTDRVGVLEDSVDHVGDRLEATVRVPRRALGLTWAVLDLTHLIHVDEGVEVGIGDPDEGATDRKALALEAARCGDALDDLAQARGGGVNELDSGQDESVLDGDGRHVVSLGLAW